MTVDVEVRVMFDGSDTEKIVLVYMLVIQEHEPMCVIVVSSYRVKNNALTILHPFESVAYLNFNRLL